jgi:hypothetical protein
LFGRGRDLSDLVGLQGGVARGLPGAMVQVAAGQADLVGRQDETADLAIHARAHLAQGLFQPLQSFDSGRMGGQGSGAKLLCPGGQLLHGPVLRSTVEQVKQQRQHDQAR